VIPVFRSVDAFRSLLLLPRIRPLVVSSLLARLPKGMMPLTLVVLVERQTGSYSAAGAVAALFALGDAATAPWQGRLVDRYGATRTLIPIAVLHVLAVIGLMTSRSSVVLAALAALAGVGVPPISGTVKALWAELVAEERLPTAYAMESLLQQSFFLLGPLVATGLISVAGPAVTAAAAGAIVAGGTIAFVVAAGTARPTERVSRRSGALRIGAVRILCISTLLQSMTFGVLPVGLVAVSTRAGMPTAAGIVQAGLTFGGVVGTFRTVGGGRYLRLMTTFSCCLLPLPFLASIPSYGGLAGMATMLVATGFLLTPLAAASYLLVRAGTPADCRTEAFAWLSTGQAAGTALGSAIAGALIDHAGPVPAFVVPPVAVALAALLLKAGLRTDCSYG
jgi:MFS family permease